MGVLDLETERLARFANDNDLALVILFGSQAQGRAREGSDTDLALMPAGTGPGGMDRLRVEGELAAVLGRGDLDLVWLPEASWLLAWEVAQGCALFESRPGTFADFKSVARLRRADAWIWIERDRAYLNRSLGGAWQMNVDLVRRKLGSMTRYLRELEPSIAVEVDEFVATPERHYTAERLTQLLVDGAAAINTEVAQVVAGIPPSDYYGSFFCLAQAGWIDSETAGALAPLAQLRNRLVHDYEVVGLPGLQEALRASLSHWRAYLQAVHARLEAWEQAP